MTTVVLGPRPPEIEAWLERRRELGQDLFDEMWAGEYVVVPGPAPGHGLLDQQLAELLGPPARRAGLIGSGPLNIGVADDYRVPDRTWLRPPAPTELYVPTAALVVEVVSPNDRSRRKLGFYAARGVDEVVLVDPAARRVEWFARERAGRRPNDRASDGDRMVPVDRSALLDLGADDLAARLDWPG